MLRDDVLVAIGQHMGVAWAQAIYFALAHEPLDAYGNRVDWTVIRARIVPPTPQMTPFSHPPSPQSGA